MPHITIASPSQTLFDGVAVSITLPTITGVITVLDDHEPMIGVLSGGQVEIDLENETSLLMAVDSGMVQIEHNHVHVFTQDSVLAADVTAEMILEAQQNALVLEQKLDNANEMEYAKIAAELQKELAKTGFERKAK